MPAWRSRQSPPDSNQTASGEPGAVHIVINGVLTSPIARPSLDCIKMVATSAASSKAGTILIEGGGSPAEFSISDDIPNVFVARLLRPSIILVGDMFTGGAFAHIKGTLDLMPPDIRDRVVGIVLNRALLRGDEREFWCAITSFEELVRVPVIGVVPLLERIDIIEEDQHRDLSYVDDADIEIGVTARAAALRPHLKWQKLLDLLAAYTSVLPARGEQRNRSPHPPAEAI